MSDVLDVSGLLLGTFSLLSFSLAFYDLLLQVCTILNLFDTKQKASITWRNIIGQFVFVLILFVIGFMILLFLNPYNKNVYGEIRGLRDSDAIRNSGISAFGSLQPALKIPSVGV